MYNNGGSMVRASASWTGGRGFDPRPSHTKDYNNGTFCLLAIGAQHIRLEKGNSNMLCYAGPAGRAVS